MSQDKSSSEDTEIIRDAGAIATIGERLAASSRFAIDLEFMSADRFIPDLALVQLAWEEEGKLQMVLIDGVDTELGPVFDQIASTTVLTLAHGAKQDLSLLGTRYGVTAGPFMDTQMAISLIRFLARSSTRDRNLPIGCEGHSRQSNCAMPSTTFATFCPSGMNFESALTVPSGSPGHKRNPMAWRWLRLLGGLRNLPTRS